MKQGRLSPLGAAMAHLQLGRFAQARPAVELRRTKAPAGAVPVATLAKSAGDRGTSAKPMGNGKRAMAYAAQRGTVLQLTPAQSRRLRKRSRRGSGVEVPLRGDR